MTVVVRKNSKEYKSVKNIFLYYNSNTNKQDFIKIFITKSGSTLETRIDLETLGKEKNIYYQMTYDTILANLLSDHHTLLKDETEDFYFFHSKYTPQWDETPFRFIPEIKDRLSDFLTIEIPKGEIELHKKIKSSGKLPTQKNENKEPVKAAVVEDKIKRKTGTTIEIIKSPVIDKIVIKPSESQILNESFGLKNILEFNFLNKVLFPETDISKKDVLQYYNKIFPVIYPYIKDRPHYFRWHWGSIKESNYSKSLQSFLGTSKVTLPEWIHKISAYSESYKQLRDYFVCKDKEHLLFMIDVGCIELSPWHSTVNNIDFPDYLIIDLDPLDVSDDELIETALTSKIVFDGLKIPSFIKTSGNKGLHIYLPVKNCDYKIARDLSEFLCRLIHLKNPQLTSLERLPENRKGKVYLDYLQNAKGKTIAAPYSLRPNNFAGVATPLFWNELNKKIKIKDFNFNSILPRIEKSVDPFKKLFDERTDGRKLLLHLQEYYGFLFNFY